jgi:hypothetical protein
VKILQKRIGETVEHIGMGNNFLTRTPIVQQLRERIDKWDFTKLKSFCTTKGKNHQTEEIAHRMGQDLCYLYI